MWNDEHLKIERGMCVRACDFCLFIVFLLCSPLVDEDPHRQFRIAAALLLPRDVGAKQRCKDAPAEEARVGSATRRLARGDAGSPKRPSVHHLI